MAATGLSPAEQTFALRMLPHLKAGKSFEDAARSVIEDDGRLFEAFCDRRHSYFIATADESGRSGSTAMGRGDLIAQEITDRVYRQLRAPGLGEAA